MQRLRGPDAGWLFAESASQPSSVPILAVLEAGTALTLEDLRRHIEPRLDDLPSFRWRVERVPLGLDLPVFVEDPDFDLGYHLRRERLAEPTDAALDAYLAELSSQLLDRRHPLWRLILLDGLPEGRQAIVLFTHHTLIDGTALRTTLNRIFDPMPAPGEQPEPSGSSEPRRPQRSPWRPERVPRRRLVTDALAHLLVLLTQLPGLIAATWRGLAAVKARKATSPITVPRLVDDTPVTLLNRSWSGRRDLARLQLPLIEVRHVARAAGTSVNDVLLAVVAGALVRYLGERGDLPRQPLTVNVPHATEPPGTEPRQWGNHFANFVSSLATDVADPWERLVTIQAVTREGRERLELQGPDLIARWLDHLPPFVAEPGARRWAEVRRAHPEKAEYSVLVTNVRGHDRHIRFGEAEVEQLWTFGPVFDGAGLTVTAWTYAEVISMVVIVNPDAVERPAELAEGLRASLDELLLASTEHPGHGEGSAADATTQR